MMFIIKIYLRMALTDDFVNLEGVAEQGCLREVAFYHIINIRTAVDSRTCRPQSCTDTIGGKSISGH